MNQIRLGTIGSGMIVHAILNNVKEMEGIRHVAVYSRSREKGEKLAAEFGVDRVYTDLNTFFRDEEMNFVYIATPNLLHYPQAKQALLAGKNVILEKPFCTKLEHAMELVQLAAEKGLLLLDATPTAYLPNLEILKRELPKIGKIRLVMSNYSQYSSRYDVLMQGEVPNNFNPQYAGGCLMDINYYNVYLNTALFGKPKDATYYPNMYQNGIDTSGVMIMRYDGFVSQNAGAKDTWGVNFFQIEGEQGFIFVENGGNGFESVRVVTKTSDETFNEQYNPDRWSYEVCSAINQILHNDTDTIKRNLNTMLQTIDTIEKARKKAKILFPGD